MRYLPSALAAAALVAGVLFAPVPAPAGVTSSPSRLAACFGNRGVEFGTFSAWLCEVKLGGDPSGSLYFSPSVDEGLNHANPSGQMLWYKLHAAPGAFYVWENYSDPWGGSSPRSNGRIIGIDEGPAGQCIVDWPSWSTDPTGVRCFTSGGSVLGPLRALTTTEKYSIAEYQKNMRAAVPLEYR